MEKIKKFCYNNRHYLIFGIGILTLSLAPIIIKKTDAPAPIIAFYRNLFSAVAMTPIFLIGLTKDKPDSQQTGVSKWVYLFPVASGISKGIDYLFAMMSMKLTTITNETILNNLAPLWVAIGAYVFFKQKLTRKYWIGLVLAFTGAIFVLNLSFSGPVTLSIGDLFAIISSVFYAGYMLITQRGRIYFSTSRYYTIMLYSTVICLFIANLLMGTPFTGYSSATWISIVILALVVQLIGQNSVTYALGFLPANVVSTTLLFQPVITSVLAIFLLKEWMSPLQWVGAVITLLGVYVVNHSREE